MFLIYRTSNQQTTPLSYLHVITQVILVIPPLHIKPIFFMINKDLWYFHLQQLQSLYVYLSLSLTVVLVNYRYHHVQLSDYLFHLKSIGLSNT